MIEAIRNYIPYNEQEAADKEVILDLLERYDNLYERENLTAHMTASAWVTDPSRTKILMAYHRIYSSWAWLGGHADGCGDLLSVALKEANEETSLKSLRPLTHSIFSAEMVLPFITIFFTL